MHKMTVPNDIKTPGQEVCTFSDWALSTFFNDLRWAESFDVLERRRDIRLKIKGSSPGDVLEFEDEDMQLLKEFVRKPKMPANIQILPHRAEELLDFPRAILAAEKVKQKD